MWHKAGEKCVYDPSAHSVLVLNTQNGGLLCYLCLSVAGCCCWGWAAWGLWTAGTASAWDVWCCYWTDLSSLFPVAVQEGRDLDLRRETGSKNISSLSLKARRRRTKMQEERKFTTRDIWNKKVEYLQQCQKSIDINITTKKIMLSVDRFMALRQMCKTHETRTDAEIQPVHILYVFKMFCGLCATL